MNIVWFLEDFNYVVYDLFGDKCENNLLFRESVYFK